MPRYSKVALFKFWGPLGVDDTDNTQIGTASVRLDFLSTTTIRYTIITERTENIAVSGSGTGLGSLAAGWKGICLNTIASLAEVAAG